MKSGANQEKEGVAGEPPNPDRDHLTRKRRVPELDGIRGVAVLLMLAHHYARDLPVAGTVDRLIVTVARGGWIGVDMFFVLSGYLITGVLLDARGQPHYFRDFFARRALRIFPAYYLLLSLCFFFGPALGVTLAPRARPLPPGSGSTVRIC